MAACIAIAAFSGNLAAQRPENPGCPDPGEMRCGSVLKLTAARTQQLLNSLRTLPESEYHNVVASFFDTLYSKRFADWIIFIGKDTAGKDIIKQSLAVNDNFVKDDILVGQQALFAIVFSETDLSTPQSRARPTVADSAQLDSLIIKNTLGLRIFARQCRELGVECSVEAGSGGGGAGSGGGDKGALTLSRTTLQYARDPAITAFLKSITKGVVGAATDVTTVPDSAIPLELQDLTTRDPSAIASKVHLYYGQKRLLLPVNAVSRFTIRPNTEARYAFPTAVAITRVIENASDNPFGASLGVGITVDAPDTTAELNETKDTILATTSSSSIRPNLWLLAHINLIPPRLPLKRTGLSVFVGTNVGISDLFRDLLVGFAIDRVLGDVGFIGGLNFIQRKTTEIENQRATSHEYRRAKVFGGINFVL